MVQPLLETNTSSTTPEASRDLAFFMPEKRLINQNLAGLQLEIAATVDMIRTIGHQPLREAFKLGFDEAVAAMEQKVKTGAGILWLAFSDRPAMTRYIKAEPLLLDYGRPIEVPQSPLVEYEGEAVHTLHIPTDKITGSRVMPYQTIPNNFEPALHLRIQTSSDRPQQIYRAAGQIEELPSLGSWHSFPLSGPDAVSIELAS